ncbi:hypothetical protein L596_025735 [Steinernema carpocapsae]|uniref:Uncharacterized protein n=1 Tax=Steinernema carpocapsae TaxID=34508 RepID=A0A4U5M8P1_STECR|nr:hypothetical protein L596_025735 [Steinernema carpocapsae]
MLMSKFLRNGYTSSPSVYDDMSKFSLKKNEILCRAESAELTKAKTNEIGLCFLDTCVRLGQKSRYRKVGKSVTETVL